MIWRYRVEGTIREAESGAPVEGLLVRGFDQDVILDDFLGETRTDAEGHFALEFTDEPFRSIFDENPDLYLRVYDATGAREVFSTRSQVRRSAGAEERYELRIPRDRLG